MKDKKKKERLTREQLDVNYNKFLKDKELAPNGKKAFEKILKKAVDVRQHDSKHSQT